MTVCAIAIEIGGAVASVVGLRPRTTGWLLVAFTLGATWVSHRCWIFGEPARSAHQTQFYKNLAIVGGLMLYAVAGAGPMALHHRMSGRGSQWKL
jgi:putative oxidoreductase